MNKRRRWSRRHSKEGVKEERVSERECDLKAGGNQVKNIREGTMEWAVDDRMKRHAKECISRGTRESGWWVGATVEGDDETDQSSQSVLNDRERII